MKVLFIGNSYTYYNEMPKLLEAIAAGNGKVLQTQQVTKGGWYLHKYLDEKNEFHTQLMEYANANRYDVCFLQEQSLCPYLDYRRFADGAKRLAALLKDSVGEFILYQTWARKEGSDFLEENHLSSKEFGLGIAMAYEKLGIEMGIRLSPVGRKFARMSELDPDIELYHEDKSHPSYAGSCLAALQHYHTLFGEVPENTAMLSLPQETCKLMCKLICENEGG